MWYDTFNFERGRDMGACGLVFLAGILRATMQSFNGVLRGYVGQFGTSFVTHVVGGVLLIGYILLGKKKIRLGPMPWYLYSAGFFGLALVAGGSFCVGKIGPALNVCLSICGQLTQSILMDHFGWQGMKRTPFNKRRIPALAVILAGVLVMNFAGQEGLAALAGNVGYLLMAFLIGCVAVFSSTVNYQATQRLGTANGTLINYLTASALSAVLLAGTGSGETWAGFGQAPAWVYLGGVCGVVALVIIVVTLNKITLFQSTTFLLAGELVGAVVLDAVLYHSMSPGKLVGVAIVATGVVWDKRTTLAQ